MTEVSHEIALRSMSLDLTDHIMVNISSGNGFMVSSGNKSLCEPVLTQIYVTI